MWPLERRNPKDAQTTCAPKRTDQTQSEDILALYRDEIIYNSFCLLKRRNTKRVQLVCLLRRHTPKRLQITEPGHAQTQQTKPEHICYQYHILDNPFQTQLRKRVQIHRLSLNRYRKLRVRTMIQCSKCTPFDLSDVLEKMYSAGIYSRRVGNRNARDAPAVRNS